MNWTQASNTWSAELGDEDRDVRGHVTKTGRGYWARLELGGGEYVRCPQPWTRLAPAKSWCEVAARIELEHQGSETVIVDVPDEKAS